MLETPLVNQTSNFENLLGAVLAVLVVLANDEGESSAHEPDEYPLRHEKGWFSERRPA